MMATSKGQTIANYAISKLGCAYIYGGYGEKLCSPSFRKERAKAYPDQKTNIYKNCLVLAGKQSTCSGCKWNGKQAYDCAQLTRYSCKAAGQELVSGANSQWKNTAWDQKGAIKTLPDVPGVLLYYMNSKGNMTHTGIYIGGGYAVEARAAAYGVVKTAVKDRNWTHWAALPGVLTGDAVQTPAQQEQTKQEPSKAVSTASSSEVITMRTLRNNSKGTQVKVLQWLLNQGGYDAGEVDGIFGKKTIAAVKVFQTAKGLAVDGVVGHDTWSALLA